MRRRRFYMEIILSLLPVLLVLAVFRVYPIVVAVIKSFTNWDGLYRSDWIGLRELRRASSRAACSGWY